MRSEDGDWMAYIDGEVKALCDAKGWGHQIRRKWSVREKPVSDSAISDYEWKLIPGAHGRLPDAPDGDFDGVYYVLWFDKPKARFVFQHDTSHCGVMGPHWEEETYTHIYRNPHVALGLHPPIEDALRWRPPVGWLGDHLKELTTRFVPNSFSKT